MLLVAILLFGQAVSATSLPTLRLEEPARGRWTSAAAGESPTTPPRFRFVPERDGVVAFSLISCDFDPVLVLVRGATPPVRIRAGGLETDAWSALPVRGGENVEMEVTSEDGRAGEFEILASAELRPPSSRPEIVRAAIERWRAAEQRATSAGDTHRALSCLGHAAGLLSHHGPFSEARTALETVRAKSAELRATETGIRARIALANLDRFEGRIDAAIAELVRVRDETTDPKLLRVRVLGLDALGAAYWAIDRLDLARAVQEEQLRLAVEMRDAVQEFLARVRLGATRTQAAEFEEAAELLAKALESAKVNELSSRECEAWLALGWNAEEQGRYSEAAARYRQALDLDPEPIVKIDVLGSLGNALLAMHEIAESRRRFEESQDLARRIGLTSYAAKYLLNRGNLELREGELDVAIAILEKAQAEWGKESGARQRSAVLLSLSQARFSRSEGSDVEQAVSEAREAIELGRKHGDLRTEIDGTLLLANAGGADAPAPPELRARMDELAARANSSMDLEAIAKVNGMLAWEDWKAGRDEAAIAAGNRTYECFADLGEDEQCLLALDTVARAALRRKDPESTARALDRAALLFDDSRSPASASGRSAAFRSQFAAFEGFAHDLLALRLGQPGLDEPAIARLKSAGFQTAGEWKARSLVERLIRKRSEGASVESEPLKTARAEVLSARERLQAVARLGVRGAPLETAYESLRSARDRLEDLERAAHARTGGDDRSFAPRGYSTDIVRTALPDERTALVELVAGTNSLYAYVLTKDRLDWLELGDRQSIEQTARCFTSLIVTNRLPEGAPAGMPSGAQGLLSLARTLHAKLLAKPLAVLKPSVDRLVVVPTTELADVPLEALVDSASPATAPELGFKAVEFVVKKYVVAYAPSTPALVELELSKRTKASPSMLIFADPAYSVVTPATSATDSGSRGPVHAKDPLDEIDLDSLEHTRTEASQIASLFSSLAASAPEALAARDALGILAVQNRTRNHHRSEAGFELFLGPEATAERFCDCAPRYTILHLAAHGLETAPGYADPILVLSRVEGRTSVLSCAQILQLDLSADLVVLSACDSARGRKIGGDGIHSLARAFLHAGARGVVASLWEAQDLEAWNLMTNFYRKFLQEGLPGALALKEAKREMLAGPVSRGISQGSKHGLARYTDTSDPYYWAPFVLLGSGE